MKLKKNLAFSNFGLVINPNTGDSFSTNPIGIEILKMLQQGMDNSIIKSTITKTFGTDDIAFEKDFKDFVKMLYRHNLIESEELEEN